MIRYDLECEHEHTFDGWFSGSESFEKQLAAGLVECAVCGTTNVHKALMAPSLKRSAETHGGNCEAEHPHEEAPRMSVAVPGPGAGLPEGVRDALRKLRRAVIENSDYVGRNFAEEARRIHYGEAQQRGIYGEASAEEKESLAEEGIEVYSLPVLPEDNN